MQYVNVRHTASILMWPSNAVHTDYFKDASGEKKPVEETSPLQEVVYAIRYGCSSHALHGRLHLSILSEGCFQMQGTCARLEAMPNQRKHV
eukprot:1145511-Pelagomonas_calceolata.AAC.2